jgi:hypothetical protein
VAIANYGLSYGPGGAPSAASPPRLPARPAAAAPAGKRVVHFTPRQLQQLAEQLETVNKAELKVLCWDVTLPSCCRMQPGMCAKLTNRQPHCLCSQHVLAMML